MFGHYLRLHFEWLVCKSAALTNKNDTPKRYAEKSKNIYLRWHYPNQVTGRSSIMLPLSLLAQAPQSVTYYTIVFGWSQ